MALIIFILLVIFTIIWVANFIFLGPIIPSNDNLVFNSDMTSSESIQYGYLLETFTHVSTDITVITDMLLTKDDKLYEGCPDKMNWYYMSNVCRLKYYNCSETLPKDLATVFQEYMESDIYIYIHGFNTHATEALEFFANNLSEKMYILGPRLPGDSNTPGSFANITVYDYLTFIHEYIRRAIVTFGKITICGSSTGCSYLIWLLYRFPEFHPHIRDVIFWSPNIELHPFEKRISQLALYPCGKKMIGLLDQRLYTKDRTVIYDMYQFVHFVGIMGILRKIRYELADTVPPLTVFYTSKDSVVDSTYTEKFYEKYKGKKVIKDLKCSVHNIIKESKFFSVFKSFLPVHQV